MNELLSAASAAQLTATCVTAGVLVLATLIATWRFMLQAPLGNNFDVRLSPCRVRRVTAGSGSRYAYTVCLTVVNNSAAIQRIHGWWRRVVLPSEAGPDYDGDVYLNVISEAAATSRLGSDQGDYLLMPGESLDDQMIVYSDGPLNEICYVEYVVKYRKWTWRWKVVRWRRTEFRSQIMVAPVEREDLNALARGPRGG